MADKVQNRKDFLAYHRDTHPNRDILDAYFKRWLERLGVTEKMYNNMCEAIDDYKLRLQQNES
jgi:hypothetical protein